MATEFVHQFRHGQRERGPSAVQAKGANPIDQAPDGRWRALVAKGEMPSLELQSDQPVNPAARWADRGSLATGGCLLNTMVDLAGAVPEPPPLSFLGNSGRPSVDAAPVAISITGLLEGTDLAGSRSEAV